MATVIHLTGTPTGYQTLIQNGKHALVGDEPVASKGTDLGFSPPEFVLSGLGMCKVATVRYIARKKGWEVGNVTATLTQEVKRGENGKNIVHIKTSMHIEAEHLSEAQKTELVNEADKCYVHRLIHDATWDIAPIELS